MQAAPTAASEDIEVRGDGDWGWGRGGGAPAKNSGVYGGGEGLRMGVLTRVLRRVPDGPIGFWSEWRPRALPGARFPATLLASGFLHCSIILPYTLLLYKKI